MANAADPALHRPWPALEQGDAPVLGFLFFPITNSGCGAGERVHAGDGDGTDSRAGPRDEQLQFCSTSRFPR